MSDSEDDDELPSGWIALNSQDVTYYFNRHTQKCSLDYPEEEEEEEDEEIIPVSDLMDEEKGVTMVMSFAEHWMMMEPQEKKDLIDANHHELTAALGEILCNINPYHSQCMPCCYLLKDICELDEFSCGTLGTETSVLAVPFLTIPCADNWLRVLRAWVPEPMGGDNDLKVYAAALHREGYTVERFIEEREDIDDQGYQNLEIHPDDVDHLKYGDPTMATLYLQEDEVTMVSRLYLLGKVMWHNLEETEALMDFNYDGVVAELLATMASKVVNPGIKMNAFRVLMLLEVPPKKISDHPGSASCAEAAVRILQRIKGKPVIGEEADESIAESTADFITQVFRNKLGLFSHEQLKRLMDSLTERFSTNHGPSFETAAFLCCLKYLILQDGLLDKPGQWTRAATERLLKLDGVINQELESKHSGPEEEQLLALVSEIHSGVQAKQEACVVATAAREKALDDAKSDDEKDDDDLEQDDHFYRDVEEVDEGELIELPFEEEHILATYSHPLLKNLQALLEHQHEGSDADWRTTLVYEDCLLLRTLLERYLSTDGAFCPKVHDTLQLVLGTFSGCVPREMARLFCENEQALTAACTACTTAQDKESKLLRLQFVHMLMSNVPDQSLDLDCCRVSNRRRSSVNCRTQRIESVMKLLTDIDAQVVDMAVAVTVLLTMTNLPAETSLLLVNYVVNHPQGTIVAQGVIGFANNTEHTPNSTRAVWGFIETILDLELYEFFYSNDLRVLIEVMVRMMNDTHPSNPLMKSYLACVVPFLSNPSYAEDLYNADELRCAVDRLRELPGTEKASVSALLERIHTTMSNLGV